MTTLAGYIIDDAAPDGYVFEELAENLLLLDRADDAKPYFAHAHEILAQDQWLVTLPTPEGGGFCCTLAPTGYVMQHGCVPSGTANVV